ncbi:BTB/POZ domain-containing protein At3g19850 isoform X2 [Carica papaya]|uniref:BTB/POZ domain-containing protein At3g19850 isoform X2 n=1 Tax=Carica papaya TaxID=3649 RepID=UPI000B8CA1BF|nr:BTB/POZ domain-containing protein At3g19850 isoform X2 [Carica papaya]
MRIQCEADMTQHCDLPVHVNGQYTFFVQERIISSYSTRLKKMVKQAKRRTQIKSSGIEIDDYPGGPDGFELVARFCYNNGRINITVSNISVLHCCAVYLGMTEKMSTFNLLQQTQIFLEGMFYWSWNDVIVSLKSCESFFEYADSCGLVEKLVCALLAKIAQNSNGNLSAASPSSSSSSSETTSAHGFMVSSSCKNTVMKPYKSSNKWWFDDMSKLPPKIVEKVIKNLGAYGTDNNSLILTRFLLHYLKRRVQSKCCAESEMNSVSEYSGLAGTAVHGVISIGHNAFSYRNLFWVLGLVSGFRLSRDCIVGLERLIGGMLDQAKLDDLLISGRDGGVYDVGLVIRLLRVFVNKEVVCVQKMKMVGRLVDKYLAEISPDHNLNISKFLGVAESLPDSARDCFDGVYRAIDIFLESHPALSFKERSRLCRCLNYGKLTLESCKDLAKNPRIPPNIAVEALKSQQSKISTTEYIYESPRKSNNSDMIISITGINAADESFSEESEDMKMNLQRMQWRVVELERVCKEMKNNMSRLVRHGATATTPVHNRTLLRLC